MPAVTAPEVGGRSGIKIYASDGNSARFGTCASQQCPALHWDTAYSPLHAQDLGWVYTNDSRFCPPEQDGAWLCPTCAGEYRWVKKEPRAR